MTKALGTPYKIYINLELKDVASFRWLYKYLVEKGPLTKYDLYQLQFDTLDTFIELILKNMLEL